jgi:uncharacterized ubiquitin-like protein YukD
MKLIFGSFNDNMYHLHIEKYFSVKQKTIPVNLDEIMEEILEDEETVLKLDNKKNIVSIGVLVRTL